MGDDSVVGAASVVAVSARRRGANFMFGCRMNDCVEFCSSFFVCVPFDFFGEIFFILPHETTRSDWNELKSGSKSTTWFHCKSGRLSLLVLFLPFVHGSSQYITVLYKKMNIHGKRKNRFVSLKQFLSKMDIVATGTWRLAVLIEIERESVCGISILASVFGETPLVCPNNEGEVVLSRISVIGMNFMVRKKYANVLGDVSFSLSVALLNLLMLVKLQITARTLMSQKKTASAES
jgi:hypothetical protein